MKAVALILALAVITGKQIASLGLNILLFVLSFLHVLFLVCICIQSSRVCLATGCNARAVRQADATPDPWVESVDRFWQYIADLNQQADGVVENIKSSQLSRELE